MRLSDYTDYTLRVLMYLALTSPKGTYDELFLSNYVTINLLDRLKRVKGVGDVSLLTPTDYSMRIWIDPQRLTDYGMTPTDIVNALKKQNVQAAIGRIGSAPALPDQAYQLSIQAQGRLTTPEEFGNVVIRVAG